MRPPLWTASALLVGSDVGGVEAVDVEAARHSAAHHYSIEDVCSYEDLYPRQYVAYKTSDLKPEHLTGDLSRTVWSQVPWTEDFVDISTTTVPRLRTRAKMRWDDDHLYVAAELRDPQNWATLDHDDVVIFQDNDFEVFIDPGATTHFYKEFEMNAFNKRWDLTLNKPYSDGGYENSTRVFGDKGYNMRPLLQSAVLLHPAGAINNPSQSSDGWSVEVAFPLEKIMLNSTQARPEHGTIWRIDFSRVQWHLEVDPATGKFKKVPKCQSCPEPGTNHEDNWVWQAQHAINMHLPERWGLLQFSDQAPGTTSPARYAEWPSRSAAMAIYYAEHAFFAEKNTYTSDLRMLHKYTQSPFQLCMAALERTHITLGDNGKTFTASVTSPASPMHTATVTQDRFLTVQPSTSNMAV